MEWATKYVNNHIIVAALIVTVTFAAGFTMPGGYIGSGSENQGIAFLLTSSIAFQVYIISDTLALIISITALLLLMCTATSVERDLIYKMAAAGGVLTIYVSPYSNDDYICCWNITVLTRYMLGILKKIWCKRGQRVKGKKKKEGDFPTFDLNIDLSRESAKGDDSLKDNLGKEAEQDVPALIEE
ncbi:hypothetical protein LguiA_031049 [Lonicera macranthoides]